MSFTRQVDAIRWVATEEAKVVRGDWIDPAAGKVTFAAFYADWAPRQVWLSSTRENADLATAGVTFGDMQLRSIRRSHIEAWVKVMAAGSRRRRSTPVSGSCGASFARPSQIGSSPETRRPVSFCRGSGRPKRR